MRVLEATEMALMIPGIRVPMLLFAHDADWVRLLRSVYAITTTQRDGL
jgi:hypothetical protein